MDGPVLRHSLEKRLPILGLLLLKQQTALITRPASLLLLMELGAFGLPLQVSHILLERRAEVRQGASDHWQHQARVDL